MKRYIFPLILSCIVLTTQAQISWRGQINSLEKRENIDFGPSETYLSKFSMYEPAVFGVSVPNPTNYPKYYAAKTALEAVGMDHEPADIYRTLNYTRWYLKVDVGWDFWNVDITTELDVDKTREECGTVGRSELRDSLIARTKMINEQLDKMNNVARKQLEDETLKVLDKESSTSYVHALFEDIIQEAQDSCANCLDRCYQLAYDPKDKELLDKRLLFFNNYKKQTEYVHDSFLENFLRMGEYDEVCKRFESLNKHLRRFERLLREKKFAKDECNVKL